MQSQHSIQGGQAYGLTIHVKFKSYQQLLLSLVSVVMSCDGLFSLFVHMNDKRAVHTPYAWLQTIYTLLNVKNTEGSIGKSSICSTNSPDLPPIEPHLCIKSKFLNKQSLIKQHSISS